ncbi:30S ribosomal protein S2 [Candidatus Uhrbacteria bacterium]|nr:30S ribosomal protein S2 [Candidatus Uhrbacteria bacterium]
MKLPELLEMLKAGVHFGHQSSRWHPKMAEYIYGVRGGVHVIDLEKTLAQLERALTYVENVVARGGSIMFVGTKRQAQDIVAKYAQECGMPYVNTRWLGGTFTNFPQIQRLIKQYLDLKDKTEKGELKKYTKLEQLQFSRKIEELEDKIGGISTMTRLPEAVFMLDARHDKTAVREALATKVKIVALCDSNVNPTGISYVIPANDDAIGSLDLMASLVAEAVKSGKAKAVAATRAAAEARQSAEDEVKLSDKSKATVDDLDDAMKEKLVAEAQEEKK